MKRDFIHPKTGRETVMTFARRLKPKQDTAWIAKSLHEIERHLDMMPSPQQAVLDFPPSEHYYFPYSKLVQMAAWMTEFAEQWRIKIQAKARANEPAE